MHNCDMKCRRERNRRGGGGGGLSPTGHTHTHAHPHLTKPSTCQRAILVRTTHEVREDFEVCSVIDDWDRNGSHTLTISTILVRTHSATKHPSLHAGEVLSNQPQGKDGGPPSRTCRGDTARREKRKRSLPRGREKPLGLKEWVATWKCLTADCSNPLLSDLKSRFLVLKN